MSIVCPCRQCVKYFTPFTTVAGKGKQKVYSHTHQTIVGRMASLWSTRLEGVSGAAATAASSASLAPPPPLIVREQANGKRHYRLTPEVLRTVPVPIPGPTSVTPPLSSVDVGERGGNGALPSTAPQRRGAVPPLVRQGVRQAAGGGSGLLTLGDLLLSTTRVLEQQAALRHRAAKSRAAAAASSGKSKAHEEEHDDASSTDAADQPPSPLITALAFAIGSRMLPLVGSSGPLLHKVLKILHAATYTSQQLVLNTCGEGDSGGGGLPLSEADRAAAIEQQVAFERAAATASSLDVDLASVTVPAQAATLHGSQQHAVSADFQPTVIELLQRETFASALGKLQEGRAALNGRPSVVIGQMSRQWKMRFLNIHFRLWRNHVAVTNQRRSGVGARVTEKLRRKHGASLVQHFRAWRTYTYEKKHACRVTSEEHLREKLMHRMGRRIQALEEENAALLARLRSMSDAYTAVAAKLADMEGLLERFSSWRKASGGGAVLQDAASRGGAGVAAAAMTSSGLALGSSSAGGQRSAKEDATQGGGSQFSSAAADPDEAVDRDVAPSEDDLETNLRSVLHGVAKHRGAPDELINYLTGGGGLGAPAVGTDADGGATIEEAIRGGRNAASSEAQPHATSSTGQTATATTGVHRRAASVTVVAPSAASGDRSRRDVHEATGLFTAAAPPPPDYRDVLNWVSARLQLFHITDGPTNLTRRTTNFTTDFRDGYRLAYLLASVSVDCRNLVDEAKAFRNVADRAQCICEAVNDPQSCCRPWHGLLEPLDLLKGRGKRIASLVFHLFSSYHHLPLSLPKSLGGGAAASSSSPGPGSPVLSGFASPSASASFAQQNGGLESTVDAEAAPLPNSFYEKWFVTLAAPDSDVEDAVATMGGSPHLKRCETEVHDLASRLIQRLRTQENLVEEAAAAAASSAKKSRPALSAGDSDEPEDAAHIAQRVAATRRRQHRARMMEWLGNILAEHQQQQLSMQQPPRSGVAPAEAPPTFSQSLNMTSVDVLEAVTGKLLRERGLMPNGSSSPARRQTTRRGGASGITVKDAATEQFVRLRRIENALARLQLGKFHVAASYKEGTVVPPPSNTCQGPSASKATKERSVAAKVDATSGDSQAHRATAHLRPDAVCVSIKDVIHALFLLHTSCQVVVSNDM